MFSAATAAIMHCYSDGKGRHRDVFRSKYLNVLDFVFGNTGMHSVHLSVMITPDRALSQLTSNCHDTGLRKALQSCIARLWQGMWEGVWQMCKIMQHSSKQRLQIYLECKSEVLTSVEQGDIMHVSDARTCSVLFHRKQFRHQGISSVCAIHKRSAGFRPCEHCQWMRRPQRAHSIGDSLAVGVEQPS